MPFSKYIPIPIFIAFQAFTMMVITPFIPGTDPDAFGGTGMLSWVAFQAWAMYFLAGCTPKMGLKTLVGYLGGIIASIAIFELGFKTFGSLNVAGGTAWGLYLAVFIVVVFVISAERVPGIDFVPSYFLGAGVFFGLMTYLKPPAGVEALSLSWYGKLALPEMIACALGLVYGWWTVTVKTWYVAKVSAEATAPASIEVDADAASA